MDSDAMFAGFASKYFGLAPVSVAHDSVVVVVVAVAEELVERPYGSSHWPMAAAGPVLVNTSSSIPEAQHPRLLTEDAY